MKGTVSALYYVSMQFPMPVAGFRLFLAGVLAGLLLLSSAWAQSQAQAEIRRASKLLQANDIEAAATILEALLEREPGQAEAWFLLGGIHHGRGQLDEAARAYEQATVLAPDSPAVWFNLGFARFSQGQLTEALDAYRRVTELRPGDPEAWFGVGTSLLNLRRAEEAARALANAVDRRPDWVEALHALGVARLEAGNPAEAVQPLERALELAPDQPAIRAARAEAIAASDHAAAVIELGDLVRQHPGVMEVWQSLGQVLTASPDVDELVRAPQAFRRALEIAPDNLQIHIQLMDAYMTLAMLSDAERELRAILAQHPRFAGAWLELGNVHASLGQHADALQAFERAAELWPEWADAHAQKGTALEALRRPEEALTAYRQALDLEPGNVDAPLGAARTALLLGDWNTAITAIEAIDPGDRSGEALSLLGRGLLSAGRAEEALAALQAAVDADNDDRQAWQALGRLLARRRDPRAADAARRGEELARAEPRDRQETVTVGLAGRGRSLVIQARVYLTEGRIAEAVDTLRLAEEFLPDDPGVASLRADAVRQLAATEGGGEQRAADATPSTGADDPARPRGRADPAAPTLAEEPVDPPPFGPFVDIAAEVGLTRINRSGGHDKLFVLETTGSGAAWLDYDGDGRPDLFVANGHAIRYTVAGEIQTFETTERPPDELRRQAPDGRFDDVAERAGVADPGWAGGVAVGDFDNDGWPDLYISHFGPNRLYRNNGDGTFSDVTRTAAVDDPRWSTSAAFADLDIDGFLDLYVTNYVAFDPRDPPFRGKSICSWKGLMVFCGPDGMEGATDSMFWSAGGHRFESVAREPRNDPPYYGLGAMPYDADGDGRLDLYVANDITPNMLLLNAGDRRLVEEGLLYGVAYSGDGGAQAGMGIAVGDLEGNGRDDIVVTNFSDDYNTVYRNTGAPPFPDVTQAIGLGGPSLPYLGWGTQLLDFDFDGDLDLFVANGHVFPVVDTVDFGTWYRQRNQVFANDSGRFVEVGSPGSPAGPGLAVVESSRAAVAADMDGDGDDDLFVTNIDAAPTLLRNDTPPRHRWIRVRLSGRASNRDGIGARVIVRAGALELGRTVQTAAGYLGSNDPTLGFGLGVAGSAEIEVRWPSGQVDRVGTVPAESLVLIIEGRGVVAVRR